MLYCVQSSQVEALLSAPASSSMRSKSPGLAALDLVEHQVLEQMGEARLALAVRGESRRGTRCGTATTGARVVLAKQELEAVVQAVTLDRERRPERDRLEMAHLTEGLCCSFSLLSQPAP